MLGKRLNVMKALLLILAALSLVGCSVDQQRMEMAQQSAANFMTAYAMNGGDSMRAAVGDSTYHEPVQINAPVTTQCYQSPLGANSLGGSITCHTM